MNKSRLIQKYIILDIFASLLVWVAFVIFRKTVNDISLFEGSHVFIPNYDYFTSLILFPVCCVFVHSLSGFYLHLLKKSRVNLIFNTFSSSAIISLSVFFGLKLGDAIISYEYFYFSLFVLFLFLFCFTLFFRNIIYSQIIQNFRSKKWTINTLIIGNGNNAKKISEDIEIHAQRNTLVGFVSTNKKVGVPPELILGNITQIAYIIEKFEIHETIVVLDDEADEKQLFDIINLLYKYNVEIQFTPRLYEILTGSAKISSMGIIPLVSITNPSMSDWEVCVKRFSDIVISLISLLLLSPFLFYFVIKIKRDSKGPDRKSVV